MLRLRLKNSKFQIPNSEFPCPCLPSGIDFARSERAHAPGLGRGVWYVSAFGGGGWPARRSRGPLRPAPASAEATAWHAVAPSARRRPLLAGALCAPEPHMRLGAYEYRVLVSSRISG